ncbi:MAG: NAD-dependent epimerase/dehydratase family protein [Gemmatimonadaceae bacterium]|nr:NAD-dependent epimerase/dehydratase family protein [Gemmatimonadaceae bacterium]
MQSRRSFVINSAVATGTVLAGLRPASAQSATQSRVAGTPLNLLVLGGTNFIGPHLLRHAVARGHRVTIFTRGRRQPDLPDSIERLVGDRNGQLQALEGRRWDAVIDDSGNVADWVRQSTALLKGAVGRYLFVSSTGVFYPYLRRGLSEADPVHYDARDPKDGDEAFGVMKAQGERFTMDAFGDRGVVVRPTYIVGPGDSSDRFPYWPVRLARGGEVLAPGRAEDPVQFVDVRDLAEFMIHLLEGQRSGYYNAVGPKQAMTCRAFYSAAAEALHANVKFTYVEDYDFLKAHKIEEAIPWAMLAGNNDGMMSISNARAIGAGLRFRPLADTVRDTLAWWPSVPEARRNAPRFTITPAMETAALAAWHARGR